MLLKRLLPLALSCSLLLMPCAGAAEADGQPLDTEHAAKMARGLALFKERVRGVLVTHCLDCHGGGAVESKFDLSTREHLLVGGGKGEAIEPGKPQESRLYRLVAHLERPHMPEGGEKLPEDDVAAIAKWIELGSPYDKPLVDDPRPLVKWTERTVPDEARQWWSLVPLRDVVPPQVQHVKWPQNDIDRFILAQLEKRGLAPNPETDRRHWIRRAYFDLIGLPPKPEAVEAFLADEDPRAYEKVLDELLASQHYGERWGRHWLDVARFAESHGFEQDYDRPYAYHYRDFVIQALNQDMPFDQFVRWQLAGDEIAPNDPLAMMATGFLGAGVFPTQITKNEVERTRYDALDDMAATTGTAMLGLTIGCARCHDHKFDPIPQADYYRFASTFTTTVRSNIELTFNQEEYQRKKTEFDRQHAPYVQAIEVFEREQLPARFAQWEENRGEVETPAWVIVEPQEAKSSGGATFRPLGDGSLLAEGANAQFDTYTFTVDTNVAAVTAVRLEALAHESMKKGGPGRASNGNFALTDFHLTAQRLDGVGDPRAVALKPPVFTFEQQGLPAAATIDDNATSAWAVDPEFGKDHAIVFETAENIGFESGTRLVFTLKFENNGGHNIGRPRLSISTRPRPIGLKGKSLPQQVAEALGQEPQARMPEQVAVLFNWYKHNDEEWQKLNQAAEEHLKQQPQSDKKMVMVTSEGFTPIRHHTQGADFFEQTYFLRRGDTDQKEGVAKQSYLQVLMTAPEGAEHWRVDPPEGWRTSYRRRSLANWITDTKYGAGHLLARVIVNRLWQHHFGEGIVTTPNDFGRQGKPPTHPDLLEWLARDLIDHGWRLKRLHKLMMLSAAYRQTSDSSAEKTAIDPYNQYLWRFTPRRLEAEIIRDSMLKVSGLLDEQMFGPGTLSPDHQRRSIYFMVKRSKLIPMMTLFDAPEPLVSVGERPETTIAPQALLFMNNNQVRKCAQGFASSLPADDIAAAIVSGYRLALSRQPDEQERQQSLAFITQQEASYRADGHNDARRLALADFCQVLLSLNEFVYVE